MAVHTLRPRPLHAGAELPPRRIISLTVARVFKDCVKEFRGFRHPTQNGCAPESAMNVGFAGISGFLVGEQMLSRA
jgi:hypothetical protein